MMPPGAKGHIDQEQAEQYSRGVLSEQVEAELEEHLLVCETCRREVAAADKCVGLIRSAAAAYEAEQLQAPKPRIFILRPAWLLAAAAFLLVAVLLSRIPSAGAPVAVQLSAVRGGLPGAIAPAGADLLLKTDLGGVPPAGADRMEVVEADGRVVWSGPIIAGGTRVPRQPQGYYFVRVIDPGGETLREYALEVVKTPAASNVPR